MKGKVQGDYRFRQCGKEALIMLALFVLNVVWWYGFAYGLGSRPVETYGYVLGLPDWFFYSCVLGYLVFSVLAWLAVRVFFRDIPLDDTHTAEGGDGKQ
ncbi:MAG TPA: YhdT family protein [Firmicutes bacterium]|nr:hypothetical protein [Bacillota bacterium]HHV57107.1 YhdT family protein [Bacillota bacterium]